eukprot:TRINITY_DN324_c0_g1_i11.p2 TRINITY_DN324_c0_g1~~TRINITY_DN324_c0_g1_i11.p2  ORF type:complete len:223 (+),score=-5.50 TRINITY_DN324_c0_g1_i11:22-669(+)
MSSSPLDLSLEKMSFISIPPPKKKIVLKGIYFLYLCLHQKIPYHSVSLFGKNILYFYKSKKTKKIVLKGIYFLYLCLHQKIPYHSVSLFGKNILYFYKSKKTKKIVLKGIYFLYLCLHQKIPYQQTHYQNLQKLRLVSNLVQSQRNKNLSKTLKKKWLQRDNQKKQRIINGFTHYENIDDIYGKYCGSLNEDNFTKQLRGSDNYQSEFLQVYNYI